MVLIVPMTLMKTNKAKFKGKQLSGRNLKDIRKGI